VGKILSILNQSIKYVVQKNALMNFLKKITMKGKRENAKYAIRNLFPNILKVPAYFAV